MLPESIESVADVQGTWHVAHTKARFEKAFAWDLHRKGIAYYLPMIERVRVSGGRKRRVMAPLFVSYVFFCGSDEDRHTAMTTNRLCQTIEVPDQFRLIQELSCLEQALSGHAELDPYPFAVVGHRCRVIAGPMIGLVGTVVRRDKLARLVLEVSMLGQGASLDIECDLLEPTDD
jgi:transcription antitermination factor NusG